jgi:hypothetical protein
LETGARLEEAMAKLTLGAALMMLILGALFSRLAHLIPSPSCEERNEERNAPEFARFWQGHARLRRSPTCTRSTSGMADDFVRRSKSACGVR